MSFRERRMLGFFSGIIAKSLMKNPRREATTNQSGCWSFSWARIFLYIDKNSPMLSSIFIVSHNSGSKFSGFLLAFHWFIFAKPVVKYSLTESKFETKVTHPLKESTISWWSPFFRWADNLTPRLVKWAKKLSLIWYLKSIFLARWEWDKGWKIVLIAAWCSEEQEWMVVEKILVFMDFTRVRWMLMSKRCVECLLEEREKVRSILQQRCG